VLPIPSRPTKKESNPVPIILQSILTIAFLFIVILAFMGAVDYMKDSVKIFMKALRRYRERSGRN
jgi:hypothetical protein